MRGRSVFVAYRRQLSWPLAQLIYDDLIKHNIDAFMDLKNLDSGEFEPTILSQIEAREHFIVLLEPGSLDRIGEDGDWLRREIAHALAHCRNVVPVTANGFKFRRDLALPPDVTKLPSFNAVAIPQDYFPEAMKKLRRRFLKMPPKPETPPIPENRVVYHAPLPRPGTPTNVGASRIRPLHAAQPKVSDSLLNIQKLKMAPPKRMPQPKDFWANVKLPATPEAPTTPKTHEQIEREADATRASAAEAQTELETPAPDTST